MTIPETIQAMVLEGHGGLDMLKWHDDWPTHRPSAGQVLLHVTACGLNKTDVNTRSGWYYTSVTEATTGASGGIGSALIRLAKRRGASVIAMASAAKHEALPGLGGVPDREQLREAVAHFA